MNIAYMKEYVCLVRHLNFTTAAKDLFITQPVLTRHISFIEENFGTQLLIRSPRAVELTPAGKIVYEAFIDIISQYDNLANQLNALSCGYAGTLKFGILSFNIKEYAYPLIKTFRNNFPNTKLQVFSCHPYQVSKNLKDGDIDIGLKFNDISYTSHNNEYVYIPLSTYPLYAITLPNHPFAQKTSISPAELSDTCIIMTKVENDRNDYISHLLSSHGTSMKNIVFTDQIDTLILTLEETNGVYIATSALKNLSLKDLVFLKIDSPDFSVDLCLVYLVKNKNPAITNFVNCARKVILTKQPTGIS